MISLKKTRPLSFDYKMAYRWAGRPKCYEELTHSARLSIQEFGVQGIE